ncbi:hypothetical protein [Bradyrhizobium yuanmingense]|uniref:hypothetical protein n=1 Tax=Bradyrhizobium yuanmingense TaxID=108015 RepID=UPI000AAFE3B3|nr:hypothetical protein [Bradyrhizobium yuanmingense]
MDFNALSPADNGPAPHSCSSPAGPREFERELMALHEIPEYSQDLIWQQLGARSSRVEPSLSGGERSSSQQPIAQHRADASDFGNDLVWQDLEPWLMRAGSPHAGPSQAEPTLPAVVAPPEIGEFAMANGRRAKDDWVFIGQTATPAQIEMLRSRDLIPTRDVRITTFTILGVPHTAEWREEGFIRLKPSLDPSLWPVDSSEHSPSG